MDPTRGTAGSIVRAGIKVEVSFEGLRDVWFPATVIEDLGNNLLLVEYQSLGIDNEPELRKVTVDLLNIRPSTPPLSDTNFVLLEKVDAFYDFGWWTGVITKKLADNRYIVYFKHSNKERELSHLELRLHVEWKDDKWFTSYQVPVCNDVNGFEKGETSSIKPNTEERASVLLSYTGPVEDTNTTSVIDKETSIVATAMKRTKVASVGSNDRHLKPSKKLKPDETLYDVVKSKEASKPSVRQSERTQDDQNSKKTETLSRAKRTPGRQAKAVALNIPMITSAKKKKGKSPAVKGDSAKITTPNVVEKEHDTKEMPKPITCVIGLQCKTVTISQMKKPKIAEDVKNPPEIAEPVILESRTPLSPKTTGNLEETEADGGTTLKKKRGRPFKTQDKRPKSPLPLPVNGDAAKEKEKVQVTKSPNPNVPPQKKNPLKPVDTPVVNVEKTPNISSGKKSTVQFKSKSVKGKRGKRRKISSITVGSSPQGGQDSSWKQKENGGLENETSEVGVEKSLDLSISDDQPLSRWFEGIQHHGPLSTLNTTSKKQTENVKSTPTSSADVVVVATNGPQNLSFEKRSTLWSTLESMELFKMIPQKPHFRPLDSEKECTREGQAIAKMVTYLRVVEATSQVKLENPRTVIEDNLESLVELESHGFDVKAVRDRLTELLSIKDKQERLEQESKKLKQKMEVEKAEAQRIDKEIELVDKQVVALLEKRAHVLLKKEKKDSEVGALESEADGIIKGISEAKCKFDGLAASELCVSNQQTPP